MRYLLTLVLLLCGAVTHAQSLQKTVGIGDTDVRVRIRFVNDDGTPATGLGDTEIALYYQREGSTVAAEFSSGDKSGLDDAHSDGAIGELGSSGVYEIDVPDAAFASSATSVYIWGTSSGDECIGATIQVVQTLSVDANGHAEANVVEVSGESAPADNLETAFGNTLAEVSGVPSATDPLWEKVGFLFQALTAGYENTTSNGGEKRYKNAAGTVQWEKDLTDNGTTYTESAGGTPD